MRAFDLLHGLLAEVEALELDRHLAERAGEMAASIGLRGPDAVHLASYEELEAESSVFVVSDAALANAARALGHAVAAPGA